MSTLAAAPIGERPEIDAVLRAIEGDARLVTITGPVGVGKSFIARRAARIALDRRVFEGVVEVDASGAVTLETLVSRVTVALALAAPDRLDADAEQRRIARALELRGQALLVLDGLEERREDRHASIRSWLAQLLAEPIESRVLVTSRARMSIREEHVVEVAPLAVTADDRLDGPAMSFFLACARRAAPAFAPKASDAAHLAAIVRELDGLPLALELAAARLAVMAPAALLHRLRSSRSVLRAKPTVSPADPHRSFDAAMEGSWTALHAWERTALVALCPFASFEVDDAEAVVDLRADPAAPRVIEIVEALRDKSLLAVAPGPGLRLRLLACIADFVRRRADPGALEAANEAHAARFGALAERLVARPDAGLVEVQGENLLALIRRALARSAQTTIGSAQASRALWALLALAPDLEPLPSLAAHAALLDHVIDATDASGAAPRLLARAYGLRGALRRRSGELAPALKDLGRAIHLARASRDHDLEAALLGETAEVAEASGQLDAAASQAQECLKHAAGRTGEGRALLLLSRIEGARGSVASMKALAQRAVALAEARGDDPERRRGEIAVAAALIDLRSLDEARSWIARARAGATDAVRCDHLEGLCFHEEGDLDRATARYAAAASGARSSGLAVLEAEALVVSGLAAIERRSLAEAYAKLALAATSAQGSLRGLAEALLGATTVLDADARAPIRDTTTTPVMPLHRAIAELARSVTSNAASGSYDDARAALARSFSGHALARIALRAFDRSLAVQGRESEPPADAFVVGPRCEWFRAPGSEAISLERRRPLAAILERLVVDRQGRPGAAVGWSELLDAAWPGERMAAQAGIHRVRVAISTLRKLGLREVLLTTPDGYALDHRRPIFRAERAPS